MVGHVEGTPGSSVDNAVCDGSEWTLPMSFRCVVSLTWCQNLPGPELAPLFRVQRPTQRVIASAKRAAVRMVSG